MEAQVKSEIMSQDIVSKKAVDGPKSGGDGMDTVQPDRLGDTDNTNYVYKTNTEVSASGDYANRIDPKTGQAATLKDTQGEFISENSATSAKRKQWLNKKYEPKSPIFKAATAASPKLDELVTVGTGTQANYVRGTHENPNQVNMVLPNSLFIDGKVSQEDVRQYNLGDCYFLAALLQVIHNDPSFLPSIMKTQGDEVYVELCHREGNSRSGYRWVRKPIAVKWGENLRGQKGSNGSVSLKHFGSRYRIKYDPESEVKWSANFDASTLKIDKVTYYQAAMWVQCIERAYADFSKLYGQEGKGNEDSKNSDRYNNIDGGTGYTALRPLLGDAVIGDAVDGCSETYCHQVYTETDKRSLMDSSDGLFESLVMLAQLQDGSGAEHMYIETYAMQSKLWERVKFYSNRMKTAVAEHLSTLGKGVDSKDYQDAITALDAVVKDVDNFLSKNDSASGLQAFATIKDTMAKLSKNTSFKALGLSDYLSLKASTGTLIEDKGKHVYILTGHAYNIREMHFVDKEGQPIDIAALYSYYVDGKLDENYDPDAAQEEEQPQEEEQEDQNFWEKLWSKIKNLWKKTKKSVKKTPKVEYKLNMEKLRSIVDFDKSYAVIQNPHAQTKAVYSGDKEPLPVQGTWTTSLHELFAGITGFTAVLVKPGDNCETGTVDVKAVDGIGGTNSK